MGIAEALRNEKTQGDRGGAACRVKQGSHEVMSLLASARSALIDELPAVAFEP